MKEIGRLSEEKGTSQERERVRGDKERGKREGKKEGERREKGERIK